MRKENFSFEEKLSITNKDKTILYKGLQKIYNYLNEVYKNNHKELPKVLIFPDTSARLLVYVVKPLFDYFYKQRNLFPPAIIFIRTPQHGKSPTLKEIDLFYQRVKEIKNKFHLQGEDKILVIDDVYYKGEILNLFHNLLRILILI